MKKHRGKKGINAVNKTRILGRKKISRDKSIIVYETVKVAAKGKFVKKDQDIYYNEDYVNDGKTAGWDSIAERDHWPIQYT